MTGDGTIKIKQDGKVLKYVNQVFEKTFSGDEAVKKGQQVYFISERAVFRRTAAHSVLELIEIAPGVDLEQDILAHMEFTPVISPDLKVMDARIFKEAKMAIKAEVFGSLEERCTYNEADHSLYVDLFGVSHSTEEGVLDFFHALETIYARYSDHGHNPVNVYVNYDGFDVKAGLEDFYGSIASEMERKYFRTVKRYGGKAFRRAKLGKSIRIAKLDAEALFDQLDHDKTGRLSVEQIRRCLQELFNMRLTEPETAQLTSSSSSSSLDGGADPCDDTSPLISKKRFLKKMPKILADRGFNMFAQ